MVGHRTEVEASEPRPRAMQTKPNVVLFFVDDMGYGDVSCLNPDGKIPTPNFDRLAREGMIARNAHSTSAVCSPSRYGILTGRYNWRSTLQSGIVRPYGDPLIAADRLTVARFLSERGYHTASLGKWHLGMGWDFEITEDVLPRHQYDAESGELLCEATDEQRGVWRDAFSRPTYGGPKRAGFQYSFGVDVPNWPPYCFIENGHAVGTPSEWLQPRLLGNNQGSLQGPAMPYWNFEQLLPTFAHKADRYFEQRAEDKQPFFLYFASTSPHTPLAVNKKWIGSSGLDNLYADFVVETDAIFGELLDSLDRHGLADNTLVLFTSDNGCARYIGIPHLIERGHNPSGRFRGCKSDIWDGGHHMPFIVRWPGVVQPGSVTDELVCQTDLLATCADALGEELPDEAGEDSVSMMPILRSDGGSNRESAIHHSIAGKFAIRTRRWKLVLCPGSGGWSKPDAEAATEGLPVVQLYDLETDPHEDRNLCEAHPDIVRELLGRLKQHIADGRSTTGAKQPNDADIDIWKLDTMPDLDPSALDDY